MTLKRYYYDAEVENCMTCKFIDEYGCNVRPEGRAPMGYDGTAFCEKYDHEKADGPDNRWSVSPLWKKCAKYERCTERQADYLDIYVDGEIVPNPNDISKIDNEK